MPAARLTRIAGSAVRSPDALRMGGVLALATAARLSMALRQSYSMDEIAELRIASKSVSVIATANDGFPPLFHLLGKLAFSLGLGDWALRGIALVAGLATVVFVWLLAERLVPGAGLWAGLAMAVSPMHVQLTSENRAYSLFSLMVATFLYAAWRAVETESRQWWITAGVVGAIGAYSHYYMAVVILLAGIAYLVHVRGNVSGHALIGAGALIVLVLPVLAVLGPDVALQVAQDRERSLVESFLYGGLAVVGGTGIGLSTRALHTATITEAVVALLPWMPLLFAIVVLSAFVLRRQRVYALFIGGGLLATVLIGSASGVGFNPRYAGWVAVPAALGVGVSITRASRRLGAVLAVAFAVVAAGSWAGRMFVPSHQVEDSRAVAGFIEREVVPGQSVLASHWILARPINYYLDRDTTLASLGLVQDPSEPAYLLAATEGLRAVVLPPFEVDDGLDDIGADVRAFFETQIEGVTDYYLVYSRPFQGDPEGLLLMELSERGSIEAVEEYAGFTIYQGRLTR